jgi:mRNA-degrading endonuclease toxin of MazEF toxin-antitoxin module
MPDRHPYKRGEVVLVQFPFSGPGGKIDRPAVILSTDSYHDDWDELLLAAITSRPPRTTRTTDCALQDWKTAGLHQPSWVRSHMATVHRTLIIIRKLGNLTARELHAIEGCLRDSLGL